MQMAMAVQRGTMTWDSALCVPKNDDSHVLRQPVAGSNGGLLPVKFPIPHFNPFLGRNGSQFRVLSGCRSVNDLLETAQKIGRPSKSCRNATRTPRQTGYASGPPAGLRKGKG